MVLGIGQGRCGGVILSGYVLGMAFGGHMGLLELAAWSTWVAFFELDANSLVRTSQRYCTSHMLP